MISNLRRVPPDRVRVRRFRPSPSPSISPSSRTWVRYAAGIRRQVGRHGYSPYSTACNRMFSSAVRFMSSDGSWKTMPMSRRTSRRRARS